MKKNITLLRRAFVALLLTAGISSVAMAVPAKRVTISHTQKDGTKLTLTLTGDEFSHYYINDKGQKMMQGEDGDFYVVSDAVISAREAKADERRSMINAERVKRLPISRTTTQTPGLQQAIGTYVNMIGSRKGLVILVQFKDTSFKTSNPKTAFNNQFNKVGYSENNHIGSVHDYFLDQSYGQFDLSFDVVGPVTLSNNMSYYGGNDSSGNDKHPAAMVREAVDLAEKAGTDFSKYDWTGDGNVDNVYVVYAGYGEASGASSNTVWPHQWTLSAGKYYNDGNGSVVYDGKKIDQYACSNELAGTSGSTMAGIGTPCHEFSHCLGYPDFYDTDYTTNGSGWGMSYFDLMSAGNYNGPKGIGEVPCGYTAFERWMAGWIKPTELNAATTVTGMPKLNSTSKPSEPVAYIIRNDKATEEYFLLENRQADGWFKYCANGSSGHGLLITHCNNVSSVSSYWTSNKVNAYSSKQYFIYIPADKSYSESSFGGDFFPGTSNVTSFVHSNYSSYNGSLWNANSSFNKPITAITETNGSIGFKFMGGSTSQATTYYTVTFNAGAGSCTTKTFTQTASATAISLPTATISVSGWSFAGWATAAVSATTSKPSMSSAGTSYTPSKNVTLYAVYKKTSGSTTTYNSNPVAETTTTENVNAEQGIYFAHTAHVGETFKAPTFTTDSNGTKTYSSSNTAVATVDASTGKVTIKAKGTAVITVKVAATSTYKATQASYLINVED